MIGTAPAVHVFKYSVTLLGDDREVTSLGKFSPLIQDHMPENR